MSSAAASSKSNGGSCCSSTCCPAPKQKAVAVAPAVSKTCCEPTCCSNESPSTTVTAANKFSAVTDTSTVSTSGIVPSNPDEIRDAVSRSYAARLQEGISQATSAAAAGAAAAAAAASTSSLSAAVDGSSGCCSSAACGGVNSEEYSIQLGYSADDVKDAADSNFALGCGNPVALASLSAGETVVDLGSGAGFDCFLAAKRVGVSGRVIGIDMTEEMISKARANAVKRGTANVSFIQSTIESLPLPNDCVDVVISNCVVNLSPEKNKVFSEAFRVLKPGGRLMISDLVATRELPPAIRNDLSLFSGCMAGATPRNELEHMLKAIGFEKVMIDEKAESKKFIAGWAPGTSVEDYIVSASISAYKGKK